jgi:hypothetical protein
MTNPYASPQTGAGPSPSEGSPSDANLPRRGAGSRFCGILVGLLAVLIGGPTLFAGLVSADAVEWIVLALAGATLVSLGLSAAFGVRWTVYAIAALAFAWLAFLAIELWFVTSIEEIPRRNAILIIRMFAAAPALIVVALAGLGMTFDVASRRRSAVTER